MKNRPPVLHEYRYGGKRLQCLILLLLALAGEGLFVYFGWLMPEISPSHGPAPERFLFRFMAVFGLVGIVPLGALFASTFTHRMRIVLSTDSLIRPKPNRMGISREEVEIPYRDIERVAVEPFMRGTRVLRMDLRDGTRLAIPENMLANKAAFRDLGSRLKERMSREKALGSPAE